MLAAAWATAIATIVLALGVPLAFETWRRTRRADRMRQERERAKALERRERERAKALERREREQAEALKNGIAQLSSDKLLVRVNGVYSLERVARDYAPDQPRVMEVLRAFLVQHSGRVASQPTTDGPSDRVRRPDVQAAMTVIGRRDTWHHAPPIDLTRLDLSGLDLTSVDLSGLNLAHTELTQANLTDANLANSNLAAANLSGATLSRANLTHANLRGALLQATDLRSADLTGANLEDADLTTAIFYDADFTGASLADANLANAHLNKATARSVTNADLAGATWPETLRVPKGWVRDSSSGRLKLANRGR
jgi:uncharacterized protein YjbI with pentapeptide repeats